MGPNTYAISIFIRPHPAVFTPESPGDAVIIGIFGTGYVEAIIISQARKGCQDFFSSAIHNLHASVIVSPFPIFLWKMALSAHTRFEGLCSISSMIKGTALPPILTIRINEGCSVIAFTEERKRVSFCHCSKYRSNNNLSSLSFIVSIRKETTVCLSFKLIPLIKPIYGAIGVDCKFSTIGVLIIFFHFTAANLQTIYGTSK